MKKQIFSDPLAHLRPAIIAATNAGIEFGLVGPGSKRFSPPPGDAFVAVLCDDTGKALGPTAFHCASLEGLLQQASTVIVHAWAVQPLVYSAAVAEAILFRRNVIIVETRRSHEKVWVSRALTFENARLVITTPTGGFA